MSLKVQFRPALRAEQKAEGKLIPHGKTGKRIKASELAEFIVRQGTTVRKPDILAVMENLGLAIQTLCSGGDSVTLPNLGIVKPQIGGVTDKDGKWIDGPYTYLAMQFNTGLNKLFSNEVSVEMVSATKRFPEILTVTDVATNTQNESLTSGSMGSVKGKNLRFNATQSDEGLYLIPTAGGDEVKVALFESNTAVKLTFQWPAGLISETQYKVQIRARIGSSKTLRESAIGAILTVA